MSASVLLDPLCRPVIAHRGASADAPENTIAAFAAAIAEQADAVELDVRLTGDRVPVVIHDPTLRRTTDRDGVVAELPLSALQRADAGARFSVDGGQSYPWRDRGVWVPSLEQVLEAFPSVPLLIELKTTNAQGAVLEVLRRHEATERCVVAAADHRALERFRGSSVAVGASRRDIWTFFLRAHLAVPPARVDYRAFAVPETYRRFPVPTGRFIRAAGRLGCPVHVWTVNDPARARRLWERGVAGVITNRPAEIRSVRA